MIENAPELGAMLITQSLEFSQLIVNEFYACYDRKFELTNHPQRGCIAKIEVGEV